MSVRSERDDFSLAVNGEKIFCRGACWTPLDCVALTSTNAAYDEAIRQAVSAGMNMLRVCGTMVYEEDGFYDACDEQGVLVWQDFMFANMDYPESEPAFTESVKLEAEQLLSRLSGRAAVAVLCGNSEGEQQAAMWGAPRNVWEHPLFYEQLPLIVKSIDPGAFYWPSSAHGGAFPHQPNCGTSSYYGLGAYRLPLTDARRSGVRFATECLALANVPEGDTLALRSGDQGINSSTWKQRAPRDIGAGWDFDDIRDFYFAELFGINPLEIRYGNPERYLYASRIVSGELMASAFREWRSKRSTCNGALVWFLRDLWPGAGWGIIGADGEAKAPWYYLRRVMQPRTLLLTNEGNNGLFIHVTNESPAEFAATVEISLYRDSELQIATGRAAISVPPHGKMELAAAACFDEFVDLTYTYRFGPLAHDLVAATLRDSRGTVVTTDYYWPLGIGSVTVRDLGMTVKTMDRNDGNADLSITTRRFAHAVCIRAPGFVATDQYFHLSPATEHTVLLRRTTSDKPPRGTVHALNARSAIRFQGE